MIEILPGKKYWIKLADSDPPRPVIVEQRSRTQPEWFRCIGANGQSYILYADSFIRPVEPEPVAS